MARGILVVFSEPVEPAVTEAYNAWYTDVHLPEIIALHGFVAARRFRLSSQQRGGADGYAAVLKQFPNEYLALYEVEAPDLSVALDALRDAGDSLTVSPAMAYSRVTVGLFEEIASL